jgi:L-seryl-tRNA(Ser) seleniumtransferase
MNPYLAIGVRPFINCCSTRSVHGGSIMLPEVRVRMEAAAQHFVNINELMAGASARIAELTGAEWGIVTCGSAAAIALSTAAAIAGNDPVKMLALPFTGNMVRRVVMPSTHRFPYDQAIRMVGAEIVEVGSLDALDAVDFSTVAMVAIVGSRDANSAIKLEDLVRAARPHGVPVLVDAASEHITRPNPWLARGADLVVYSGGKFLRGPQTSGLLLGHRDLIEAAWANSNPHRAFGRPMKVGKEDVIGVLTALELWFERDRAAAFDAWRCDLETIAALVGAVPGCGAELLPPDDGDDQPQLRLSWSREKVGIDGMELRRQLLEGTPRIMLDDVSAKDGSIVLEPFSLQPGEAEIVGRAIAAALGSATVSDKASPTPAADLGGDWMLEIGLLRWPRQHRVRIEQDGDSLRGMQRADDISGPLSGRVTGNAVHLVFEAMHEGAIMTFNFHGTLSGNALAGLVQLGSTTPGTRGVVSYTQYGSAPWRAVRA